MRRIGIFSAVLALCLMAPFSMAKGPKHHFEARGSSGVVRYWGNGTVHLEGRGTVKIRNLSKIRIDIDAEYGEVETITDGKIYHHFDGILTASGLGGHLEIRGWDIRLEADGFGKAWVKGREGTWNLDGESGTWPEKKWKKIKFRG